MSKSMLVLKKGIATRIEFKGGSAANNYHGQYATSDEDIQKGIESHKDFGSILTHQIYLSDTIGANGQAVYGDQVQTVNTEVVVTEDLATDSNKEVVVEESIKLGYKEVKALLIEKHGVSPDQVKNVMQAKKLIKDLKLKYILA